MIVLRPLAIGSLVLAGCILRTVPPADVLIGCDTSQDCPADRSCQLTIHQCIPTAAIDEAPPRLQQASAPDETRVVLTFSEAIAGDLAPDQFVFAPALAALAVTLSADAQSVTIDTERQPPGVSYVVSVSGITDVLANPIAEDARSASF